MLKEVRDFAHFEELCLKLGFRKIAPDEIRKQLQQLGKKSPRHVEGREAGFQFNIRGLTSRIWTTYLETEEKLREKGTDSGWVLIIQDGKVVYFSHQIFRRSEKFLFNLYCWVVINWYRVSRRPQCPECGEYMNIKRGRHLKQRFWSCEQWKLHKIKRKYTLDFNFALPPKAKRWIERVYRKRKKYIARVKKAGKQPHTAMLKRRKWMPAESKISKS